jgi:hypothetical protein
MPKQNTTQEENLADTGTAGRRPFEVEDRGLDKKLQATEGGYYDPVKAEDCDDDGRWPRRAGTVVLRYPSIVNPS